MSQQEDLGVPHDPVPHDPKHVDHIVWEPGKAPVRIAAIGRESAASAYMVAHVPIDTIAPWSPVRRRLFVTAADKASNVYDFTVTIEIDVRQTGHTP